MAKQVLNTKVIDRPERVVIDAEIIEGFVSTFLLRNFDNPQPIPDFHRDMWRLWCSRQKYVADSAPRGHAKTTGGTQTYTLASTLLGARNFALLISSSEPIAISYLQDIRTELTENESLIKSFDIRTMAKDNEAEIIGRVGSRAFKILAKGAGQKMRGIKWRNMRPDLVVVDDLEEDEQVENAELRTKLRRWFFDAVLPIGSDDCIFRVHGTILHLDSLLERLLNDKMWLSKRYSAHHSFDDFSEILWPEKFSEERLRAIRDLYISQGDPSGYSKEYLSHPVAEKDAYFRRDDFMPMLRTHTRDDYKAAKIHYVAIDFAISKSEKADRTAIVVAGVDTNNILYIVDVRKGRWGSLEIIEEMFKVFHDYHPELFLVEEGHIEKALGPFLNSEMMVRNMYLPLHRMRPTKDKISRGRSFQARHRAHGVRFDKEADWWDEYIQEMVTFPRGKHDDQVDASTMIGQMIDQLQPADPDGREDEEAWEDFRAEYLTGRSKVTGY